jgi:DNA polymerase-3 subunit delta
MPTLSISQALRRLEAGRTDPLYLLFGAETYLTHTYITQLCERILGTAPHDFNFDLFAVDEGTLPEALGIACTLPMMATYRVVVLRGIHQLRKTELPQLEQYASEPCVSTALICTGTERDLKKYPAQLREQAIAIPCNPLEGSALREWVHHTVAAQEYHMTDEAVRALLQEQDNDLRIIAQEIEKLCTYAGTQREIGLAEVQAVCQASRHLSIFALSDALGSQRLPHALTAVEQLLQQGEAPLLIFSMLVRHVRLLWSVQQLLGQRQELGRIAQTLGIPQPVCRRLITQSRQISAARLRHLYTTALEADRTFKTSNKSPQAILEGVIFALCTAS